MTEDDADPSKSFERPSDGDLDPRPIVARLIADLAEFSHLRDGEARLEILMRADPLERQGRSILGTAMLPRFQGSTRPLCEWLLATVLGGMPDFLIVLDATWWATATPTMREALVYHEMCHCQQATDADGEPKFTDDGRPVWTIKGHDIEEFEAVVRRYGAWAPDIARFAAALRDGGAI